MAINTQRAQTQQQITQLRQAASDIKDPEARSQFNKAVDHVESQIDKADIDTVIKGLLQGGYKSFGHGGRTGMAIGVGAGLGMLAYDQGKASVDAVTSMINEFSADQAARGTGDALLLALPDAGEAVIHVALAAFLAAGVGKTAKAWTDLTFDKANDKAANAA